MLSDRSLHIMTVSGIPIKLDWSWIIIFVLVTWTLAVGYFPESFPGQSPFIYWGISALSAILLFVSILLHEISHSLMAKATGLPIREITLFIFGGVAQMSDDPKSPEQEFKIAIAGPAMSLLLVILFTSFFFLYTHFWGSSPISAMLKYLAIINFVMIIFNMVPGLPLDGGRIFRAVLWWFMGNLQRATRIASAFGKGFGYLLAALGVIQAFTGNVTGGIWFVIIGLFLTQAARMAYENVFISHVLEDVIITDAITLNPIVVPSHITLEELTQDYFLKHPYKGYPVKKIKKLILRREELPDPPPALDLTDMEREVEGLMKEKPEQTREFPQTEIARPEIEHAKLTVACDEEIIGFITLKDVLSIPKDQWNKYIVEDLVDIKDLQCRCVTSRTTMKDALRLMVDKNISCLMVIDDGELKGVVSHQDVMGAIAVRMALVEGMKK